MSCVFLTGVNKLVSSFNPVLFVTCTAGFSFLLTFNWFAETITEAYHHISWTVVFMKISIRILNFYIAGYRHCIGAALAKPGILLRARGGAFVYCKTKFRDSNQQSLWNTTDQFPAYPLHCTGSTCFSKRNSLLFWSAGKQKYADPAVRQHAGFDIISGIVSVFFSGNFCRKNFICLFCSTPRKCCVCLCA